ncbi:MAG: hypothetical protein Ct9H300mP1_26790 [Planctomycetaceae bacterium]|nr:MAG: hypothetical protein Ct9H300mP1_26790 [Planctomycetaceae bacterium]
MIADEKRQCPSRPQAWPDRSRHGSCPHRQRRDGLVRSAGELLATPDWAPELVRQTWHMLPGLIPFLFWIHPHTDPLSDAFRWISLGVAGTVSLIVFVRIQGVLRPSEGRGGEAVLGYALCVLGTLWMFPEHGELGMTVLAVLAFGDGMATIGGTALRSSPAVESAEKLGGDNVVRVFRRATGHAGLLGGRSTSRPPGHRGGLGIAASLAGAAAESLPGQRLNDNIRVGLAAAAPVAVTHHLLVG